jgi:RNA polymerase sigma-70 factor (ECF subfamily)
MTPDDAQLSASFRQLYAPLCRFLAVLLGDRALAKDVAQEAFVQLHQFGAGRLSPEATRLWLFRVARNAALNELKQHRVRGRILSSIGGWFRSQADSPGTALEIAQASSQMAELLRALPEHQRAVVLLRELETMSYAEIARVLDITQAKVRVDLHRARTALREQRTEAEIHSRRGRHGL